MSAEGGLMVQRETPSTSATGKDPTKVLIIEHEGDGLDDLVGSMLSRSRNVAITMQPCSPRGDANWVRTTLSGRPRFFWRDSGLTAALGAAGRASPDLIVLIVLNPHFVTDEDCACFREIRALPALRDIPILFMSVDKHHSGSVDEHAGRFGANGYVRGPFSTEEFLAAYDAVMGK
jgi:CheY-like chemotaxis protein